MICLDIKVTALRIDTVNIRRYGAVGCSTSFVIINNHLVGL